jgi:hypothetical protein
MTFPYGEPVTVVTRAVTGVDSYGNDVVSESSVTVSGAFAPQIGYEVTGSRDTVITQPHVYLPAGTAVTPTSVLVVRGARFEVDGTPNEWRSPFSGWEPGIDVPLRKVTG